MNLVLFQPEEIARALPRGDARAEHILGVLRRRVGDSLDVGLANGPRGKATLLSITASALDFAFSWEPAPPPQPPPTTLIIGLPRPQTARKILQDSAALGTRALHFVRCERSEASYADSRLWSSGEWQRHLEAGAAQAFCTHIPQVSHGHTLAEVIREFTLPTETATTPPKTGSAPRPHGVKRSVRVALDNYEASAALSSIALEADTPLIVALGPERGWSGSERDTLRDAGFTLAHLGPRVLRLETAVTASIAITAAARGTM
ncbi:hypothetical protein AXK12_04815 [Cephaloticoccus capnophilus]|uniref:Ribosomal RNA small subunit methyltransferase E n=1 Tax=Cephaloticoccus capnophilus TaxID=1548208 RepID=A0A139SMC2_9BACT|nr:RsmE family RNA methyltransferase [Cephaloticoccus capnophilus]KXU35691.1 hypothetical protein AXK12_04815 [Cephaloticoccus capnophilus]